MASDRYRRSIHFHEPDSFARPASLLYSLAMDNLVIREATPDDVATIIELYQATGIESGARFTPEEAQEQFKVFAKYPNYRVFVAVLGDEIVATYELLIMDNLAKRGRPSGIIEDVAVSPKHQGRGIGRALMLHAKEECRLAGCYKFTLSSNSRRKGAHDFYDSLGFKRHGISFLTEIEQ